MRGRLAATAFLIAGLATPASAQNCADPRTQVEMNQCAAIAYREADAELNAIYKPARSRLPESGASALRDAQHAWITYRDKACEAEGSQYEGGSIQPLVVNNCLTRLTRERVAGLKILMENN